MKYKIGDICLINKRSYSTKDDYEFVNYLDTGNITKNSISQIQYIDLSSTKLPSRAKRIVQQNDIIYSTVRPNQEHYGFIKETPNNFLVSTGFTVLTPDQEKVDPYWLYCYLTQNTVTNQMQLIAEQNVSTYPSIRPENLAEIELDLPDLETQKKIVRILSALDQKIELNNQESENLHKIIKTFYRNTASSIKEKTKLADLAKISSGKRPTCIETNGEYAVVGARDVMGFTNEYNQEPEVIITGRVGTLGVVKRYPKKTWASDNTLIVDTKYKNYIECYLSSVDFGAYNRGSTQPLITQTDLKNFILPFNEEECDNFENKTAPLRNKMFALKEQNEDLIMLRDTLLPKLMSGTIDLDKVMTDE